MSGCAACGGTDLRLHLQVGGAPGPAGLIPTTDRFGHALGDIVRCRRCGHMQLARLPTDAELAKAYADASSDDYIVEEDGQRRSARDTLERIERHVDRGSLLDLGCWVGFLLAEARDRGWQTVGIEPSEFASAFARDRLGLDVRTTGLLEAEMPAEAFEAVFLGDVIEHLPDPAAALSRVGELLAPGGVAAIALPDAGSALARVMGRRWWSVIPTHVHYFTRHSMRTLLSRRGFVVEELGSAPKSFTVRYYLDRIGGYSPRLSRLLVGAAERLGAADKLWAPDFRDRMLVIARAPAPAPTGKPLVEGRSRP